MLLFRRERVVRWTLLLIILLLPAVVAGDPLVVASPLPVRGARSGPWEALGEVYNDLGVGIYFVAVHATLRDADGKIIELPDIYVDGDTYKTEYGIETATYIAPGERTPFRLSFSQVAFEDVACYEFRVVKAAGSVTGHWPMTWGQLKRWMKTGIPPPFVSGVPLIGTR